jgi:hypothetical protein
VTRDVRDSAWQVTAVAAPWLLLVACLLHLSPAVRLPLAALVFFLVPGLVLVPERWCLPPGLRWTLVVSVSVAVDILIAELLVVTIGLSTNRFVMAVTAAVAVAVGVQGLRAQDRTPRHAAEVR